MALDSYITLGRSGLRVSPFCLGAMTFGPESGYGAEVEDSERILSHFLDRGGNFIDTANIYSKGHSEKIIGDFFATGKGSRNRAVIATKFFCNLYPGDPNGGGAGRKGMMAQCEESLRRLRTDYIDLYWLHNWDRHTPVEETMRGLDDLVRSGKVRYIGLSDTPAWIAAQAQVMAHFRGWAPAIAFQGEYSLLARTIEGEHVAMCLDLGMGMTPWAPLKDGILTGKYSGTAPVPGRRPNSVVQLSDREIAVLDVLKRVAGEVGHSMASVALAWLRARPAVTSPLIGVRRLDQLDANLKALEVRLSAEQMDALNSISKPALNFPFDINQTLSPSLQHAGATVNGEPSSLVPLAPQTDAERY